MQDPFRELPKYGPRWKVSLPDRMAFAVRRQSWSLQDPWLLLKKFSFALTLANRVAISLMPLQEDCLRLLKTSDNTFVFGAQRQGPRLCRRHGLVYAG